MFGHSIQPMHTQVLRQRCEVLMDLLPIPYPQVLGWVHCVPWPCLLVLQDVVDRRVSCQAWHQGISGCRLESTSCWCTHLAHVSLLCCSNVRLLRLSYPHSALAATISGTGLRCSCPGLECFQSSSIPGGLLEWPNYRQSHNFCRWYQGGHGCRYWTAMEPRQIPGDTVLESA